VSSVWKVEPLLEGTSYSSSCTLVTNSSHRVVIDTGLSIQQGALLAALRARGLDPADVDLVVNTHLHVDHCGNNVVFPRAAIALSKRELQWTLAFYDAVFASRAPEEAAVKFYPELPASGIAPGTIRKVTRIARFMWNRDRVGSEERFQWLETSSLPAGLDVIPTPGHTPHHISIRVAASPPVIISGDAILARSFGAKVRTMIPHSRSQFDATRGALLRSGLAIIPGHDAPFAAADAT
jgi:N-acyl homoserine lactone hydrolase